MSERCETCKRWIRHKTVTKVGFCFQTEDGKGWQQWAPAECVCKDHQPREPKEQEHGK
jgi:hypothetical protein